MCGPNPIGIIKNTIDASKIALEIANNLKNVELKSAILDLKEEILALREENMALKQQLAKKKEYNMQFSHEDNCYWNILKDNAKDGPYCPVCWDTKKLPVRLLGKMGYYKCHNCKMDIRITPVIELDETKEEKSTKFVI